MKVVDWIRLGTGSLIAAATVAVIVFLDYRASRNESRIHDAKLDRIESAVIENGSDIAVLNVQMKALFERQGEVLDRFDNAATKAEAENAALEAENASPDEKKSALHQKNPQIEFFQSGKDIIEHVD